MFFFYWGQIQLCKIRAEECSDDEYKIAEKPLTIFSSTTKGIQLVNKKEILADGKMYDIVLTTISNGITFYYALSDEAEDEYAQNLTDWEKSNGREKSLPGKAISVRMVKYFNIEKHHRFVTLSLINLNNDISALSDCFFYRRPFKNVFSPPPDHLFS